MNPPFEPRRFRTTVEFYARYRLSYPDALLARVWDFVALTTRDGVLDLGCGPGLLAVPFAKLGARVTAIDPEPGMIAAPEEAAQEAGVNIETWQASSFALPDGIGPFKLVTMGRSFHWMDRAKTLRSLDHLVTQDGAVAVLGDVRVKTPENSWREKMQRISDEYGEAGHSIHQRDGDARSNESLLMDSVFPHLTRVSVIGRHEIPVDDVIGRAFSMSRTSKEVVGRRAEEFEKRLRDMLAEEAPNGVVTEIAELYALIARRTAR